MNQSINIEKLILELVLADNYQPLKPKAIAKKLELLEDEKKVRRTIRKLVKAGRIAFGANTKSSNRRQKLRVEKENQIPPKRHLAKESFLQKPIRFHSTANRTPKQKRRRNQKPRVMLTHILKRQQKNRKRKIRLSASFGETKPASDL